MLIVLVGARGAGKSTLLDHLKVSRVTVLQPSTTRAPRSADDTEFDFVNTWQKDRYAWGIPVGSNTYGMRRSELARAVQGLCVTVFEPLNLHVFEEVRADLDIPTLTIGLDTIADVAEQHARVGGDPSRLMDAASLDRVRAIVAECDVVLSGDQQRIAEATMAMVRLLGEQGGLLAREDLLRLIRAGSIPGAGGPDGRREDCL